ncbi:ATP-binding cassette transporter [Clonorchis sinensis]|uniref:ATP-binding cassette transporter n=1 Tax=Clonorchis sinensis TaxID=79923 RepID=G7YMB6_CLOSI|nr:ATP-binding cassette transporter [Clonorchis sinensis]
MEKDFTLDNSHIPFQLIRSTGQKKTGISKTKCEKDRTVIHSLNRRLERRGEHFKEQSCWSPSVQKLEEPSWPEWKINNSPPLSTEIQREMSILQRDKAPGADELHVLFKEGIEVLVNILTTLLLKV